MKHRECKIKCVSLITDNLHTLFYTLDFFIKIALV